MEPAKLGPILAPDHRADVVESYLVAFIADLADGHQRSGGRGNVEDRLKVAPSFVVGQVQLLWAKVGDGTAIPHAELLTTSAPS